MAYSSFLLADLKGRRCSSTIGVRLLRFWEARNLKPVASSWSSDRIKISGNENPTASDYDPLQQAHPLETTTAHVQPACGGSTVESYLF
ncbi:hypothetical protein Bca4012_069133 [Brassica carinata]